MPCVLATLLPVPQSSLLNPERLLALALDVVPTLDPEGDAARFLTALRAETGWEAALWLREGHGYRRAAMTAGWGGTIRRLPPSTPTAEALRARSYFAATLPDGRLGAALPDGVLGTGGAVCLGDLGFLALHTPPDRAPFTAAALDVLLPILDRLAGAIRTGQQHLRLLGEVVLDEVEPQNPWAARMLLLRTLSAPSDLPLGRQLERALALCSDLLGAEVGIIGRAERDAGPHAGGTYTVHAAHAPGAGLDAGTALPLQHTLCALTLDAGDVLALDRIGEGEHAAHPHRERFGTASRLTESYLGVPLRMGAEVFGTISFSSSAPREDPFSEADHALLRLLAPWVASLLERERDARRIQEVETQLQTVAEQAPVVLFALDAEGRFTLAEGHYLEALGQTPEALIGHSSAELFGEDGRAAILAAAGGEPAEWGGRLGELFYEARLVPSFDEEGRPDGATGVCYDVTEREQTARALRRTSLRFRRILEAAPDAVVLADAAGRITYVNPAFTRLFGWRPEEAVGQTTAFLYAEPDGLERAGDVWLGAEGPPPPTPYLLRYRRKDGTTLLGETTGTPVRGPDGALTGFLGFARDVTEREATRAALDEQRALHEHLAEHATDLIYRADPEGRLTFVNPAALRHHGYADADALLGRPFAELVHPDHRETVRARLAAQVADGLPSAYYEFVALGEGGGAFWVGQNVDLIYADGRLGGVQIVARDNTAQKRLEAELRRTRDDAEAAAQAKERFLANMSHEMRTPLNAVLGLAHLLSQTPLSDEQADLATGITVAGDALLVLINDLLDMARLESGRLPFEAAPFRLEPLLRDLLRLLHPRAVEKGLTLRLALAEAVPPVLVGDAHRLRQVLLNLLSNAVKFTDRGWIVLRAEAVQAPTDEDGDTVRLRFEVADTGPGIPEEEQGRIFDAFAQARSDDERHHEGTGLGLAIVKETVEQQGGRVELRSTEGEGSVFAVELPFGVGADAEEPAPATPADLTGVRVLLVEDNRMNRFVAVRHLASWGAETLEAEGGEEALRLLQEQGASAFDLVLMDLQMPGMDGVEATRRIREELGLGSDALPILALTASVLASQRQAVMAAGFDDFVLKPFEPGDLRGRIAALLGRAPALASADGAGVERGALERSALGDPAVAVRLIDLFCAEAPAEVHALAEAAAEEDWERTRALAHRLKGQAGYVGADALAGVLWEIERRVDTGQTAEVGACVRLVAARADVVVAALRRMRDDFGEATPPSRQRPHPEEAEGV